MDTASIPNLGEDEPVTTQDMEISEQVSTYRFFNGLVKWGSLGVATAVFFLVLLFCAHAGFFPSLILAAMLLAAGVFGLRGKVAADPVRSPA